MSTLGQPVPPAWRQEVNRRLAEHKNRKANASSAEAEQQPSLFEHGLGSSRAAQAAARVAARYAQAKSYSQMQAEEARMAVRAAEIATKVALEAQSAAETALAGLHAATVEEPARAAGPAEVVMMPAAAPVAEPSEVAAVAAPAPVAPAVAEPAWNWAEDRVAAAEVVAPETPFHEIAEPELFEPPVMTAAVEEAAPVAEQAPEAMQAAQQIAEPVAGPVTDCRDSSGQVLQIRWEPDMPLRKSAEEPEPFELAAEDWWTPAAESAEQGAPVEIDAHAIPANLIEFPRELVATRRMRPRLLEGQAEPQAGTQLSIFEVDPGSVAIEVPSAEPAWANTTKIAGREPAAETAVSAEKLAANPVSVPVSWATSEWLGMKLEAPAVQAPVQEQERVRPDLAPFGRRMMTAVVDSSLVIAAAAFLWLTLALGAQHTLAAREAEILGGGVLVVAALAYQALFCFFGVRTPGMRYAGLALSTFDDESPTPAQMRKRLGAMALSMLPLGLGLAWSIFDEDHLSWHDRHSQTYLRMC